MKTKLLLLLLLVMVATGLGQEDPVLSESQGHRLTVSKVLPSLELLVFLSQSDLSEDEIMKVLEEGKAEFEKAPSEFLTSMKQLEQAMVTAKEIEDPTVLGDFRQQLISEFYRIHQENQSAFLEVLFQRAPVIAFDQKTGIALTQPDLLAGLKYLDAMNSQLGSSTPLQDSADSIAGQFDQLDAETQKLLASGTVLLDFYQSNIESLTQAQQEDLSAHFRQTVGGPPGPTRSNSAALLTQNSQNHHDSMIEALKASGGDSSYWNAVKPTGLKSLPEF